MENATEHQLRAKLRKAGYLLRKSRTRDIGGYMIVNGYENYVVAGSRYELTLSEVEAWADELAE